MMRKALVILLAALTLTLTACGRTSPAVDAPQTSGAETALTLEEQPQTEAPAEQQADVQYTNAGLTLTIPADKSDLVLVDTPQDDPDGLLFIVKEKDSVEAAAADGHDASDGYGSLFEIRRMDRAALDEMLAYDMSGMEIFAKDADGNYYLYTHPTDVRIYRQNNDYDAGIDQWTTLNEWAYDDVRSCILADNAGLTAYTYGNAVLDRYLTGPAVQDGGNYTVSTSAGGPLSPKGADASPYTTKLLGFTSCEDADNSETPDGESIALSFPEDDVRFDFFLAEGKENVVRMVWWGGNEQLMKLTYSDDTKASAVMQEWYSALAAASNTAQG